MIQLLYIQIISLIFYIVGLLLSITYMVTVRSKAGYMVAPMLWFAHGTLFYIARLYYYPDSIPIPHILTHIISSPPFTFWSSVLRLQGVITLVMGIFIMLCAHTTIPWLCRFSRSAHISSQPCIEIDVEAVKEQIWQNGSLH